MRRIQVRNPLLLERFTWILSNTCENEMFMPGWRALQRGTLLPAVVYSCTAEIQIKVQSNFQNGG